MTDYHLTLFCLVDGEATSNAFPVSSSTTTTVGELKDLIKAKKSPEFDDIAADKLALWRVLIPITDDDDEVPIALSSFDEKKKLGPATRLSKVFPEDLPEETVHIIVQRPPQVHAPIPVHLSDESRPASPTDIRADLDKIADEFFSPASRNITFLNEFVQGSHDLPVTKGSISGLPTVGKRGLERPRTAPSLLFVNLPAQSGIPHNQAERILTDFPGKRHLPLFG
ncbi:hypothetical protein BGX23_004440, partial [Mortierella sp. AD031]